MTAGAETVERSVRLEELQVGELLAEGGEGRVFELPRRPHLVFKCYRQPAPREFLDDLVYWPDLLGDAALVDRVQAATAWPAATVIGSHTVAASGAGVLLPRAPRRFALRHRDGTTRLATLSYLTADPAHRAVAYGLSLPDPVSPERLGLVYALARLLEAFESASPPVGHGDLSTKNVLWSLQRGPEVFVIDCDNCERFDSEGRPLTPAGRRRAMTPNWDDPAVPPGTNPTLASDRYSLALIFLRVVGAANFPIQARQRLGEPVAVDFAVPRGRFGEALLGPGAPLWDLCERGLSMSDPAQRPAASAWVAALEAVLDMLGAAGVMRAVWAAQGGGSPSSGTALRPAEARPRHRGASDVVIRPVLASPRPAPRWTLVPPPAPVAPWRRPQAVTVAGIGRSGSGAVMAGPAPAGFSPAGLVSAGSASAGSSAVAGGPVAGTRISAQAWAYLMQASSWWAAFHRHTILALWTAGHRGQGLRHLALCVLLDVMVALVGLFVVGMIVSPILGI